MPSIAFVSVGAAAARRNVTTGDAAELKACVIAARPQIEAFRVA